jgi:hypothetical protein
LLGNQADGEERLEVMGKGRARQFQLRLQFAHAHSGIAGADKHATNPQAGRIAEGLKTACRVIDLHVETYSNIRKSDPTVFLVYPK